MVSKAEVLKILSLPKDFVGNFGFENNRNSVEYAIPEKESNITKDTKHLHVGYLGQERLLPDEIYLASLNNKQEGTVNHQFIFKRLPGDSCEMDVIKRLYPESLHQITQQQYLDTVVYGNLEEVLAELNLQR